MPITIDTWPGPIKPSIRSSGQSSIALIVGTMVMWLQNSEKFAMPSRSACGTVSAVDGIVVSKPRPKNTTSRRVRARPHFGEALGEPVGERDRQRHELGGLVAGEAEHHALVAGALGVEDVVVVGVFAYLFGVRDAL